MNNTQMVHIGMINSYNVLMGKASVEDVVNSGIGMFANSPDEETAMKSIEFMIYYFEKHEMYEKCTELNKYINKTFNKDGSYKENCCECDMPDIQEYSSKIKCSTCNLTLKR